MGAAQSFSVVHVVVDTEEASMRALVLAFAAALGLCHAATAGEPVDAALVIAADVSGSMSAALATQRSGFIDAFRSPEVADAIASGPLGRIAVTYVEWAGSRSQWVVVPWTVVESAGDAAAFADRLRSAPVDVGYQTSISAGLTFASAQFATSGVEAARHVIDVSGDGANNQGPPVSSVRDALVAAGIVINGLPVPDTSHAGPFDYAAAAASIDIDAYYQDCVAGGAGSFVLRVDQPSAFRAAIRRKLTVEIASAMPRVFLASYISAGTVSRAAFRPECANATP
jgi:hypothetical protein